MKETGKFFKNDKSFFSFIFFATLIRSVLIVPERSIGIELSELKLSISFTSIFLIASIIVFSLLLSAIVLILKRKTISGAELFLALPILDGVTFVHLKDPIQLALVNIGFAVILSTLLTDNKKIPDFSLPFYSLICAFFIPNTVFSIIPLALLMYITYNYLRISKPETIILISSAVLSVVGYILNGLSVGKINGLGKLFDALQFAEENYYPIRKSIPLLLFASIPFLIIGRVFLYYFNKAPKTKRINSPKDKANNEKSRAIFVPAVVVAYIIAVIGLITSDSLSYFTINLLVPFVVIILLVNKNKRAEQACEAIRVFFEKHQVLSLILLICFECICYTLLYRQTTYKSLIKYVIEYI